MKRLPYLMLVLVLFACSQSGYKQTDNGIIVNATKTGEQVRLSVYSNKIIRVSVVQSDSVFSNDESLMVNGQPDSTIEWKVQESADEVELSTNTLSARVNKETGYVQFLDQNGNVILAEAKRNYGTQIGENLPETSMQEIFESPSDEAFYGLGQHQNGEVNYKGLDVELQQNNIVAVVPFLYSNKQYGILWDNYSITRFGDPRDYEPISSLKVFDADGNEGGLTAKYYDFGDHLYTTRIEKTIDYTTLDEQNNYPDGFKMDEKSTIVWEGELQSVMSGQHKFKLWAAGYYKLWIDGELIFDKWRQCWNPWFNKFYIDMQAGEKHHLKIEWKPDANISYIGLTYLDDAYAENQQNLSLSSEAGKQIDYYFIKGGSADEVISGYRLLTGKAPIMPKWVMGLWQSRERYKTQDELLDVVKEYRKRQIPLDNIVLDWNYWPQDYWGDHNFDLDRFPDAAQMTKEVHDMNANIMISVWPKFYVGTENYKKMAPKGWLFTKNVDLGNLDWIGKGYLSTFYDAYNPEAREAYWESMNEKLFSKGFDAWWLDATEPDIHSNVSLKEKKSTLTPNFLGSGTEFFNAFSLQQAKGVYEGQRETDPNKRVFILTRSMFAGQQRYSAATWSGDIVSRWHDLRDQWAAGINVGLSGVPYWTTDIGGFAVERRYEHPNAADQKEWRELNVRWYQFGAFCPLFRIHGQFPYREIWNISPKGTKEYESLVYYDELRYRMMPYIYSLAGETFHNNSTIMRGLVMDFASDSHVENITDQYLFGPAFMVCPIGEFGQRNREVYLPQTAGWYDFYSNQFYKGGQTLKADAPLEKIPLYIKAGSIVPYGPEIQYTTQPTDGSIHLMVYTGADGSFSLYEDENINYNYEKGAYAFIPFKYNEEEGTLTLGQREGKFDSMITERQISITFINPETKSGFNLDVKPDQTVMYKGEELVIKKYTDEKY
ncbi:MAG: TIM-barrel domain-containing protein [Prolixibacteraceae bacterium]